MPATLRLSFTATAFLVLAGCATVPQAPTITEEIVPAGPEYVEGLGYRFEWDNGNSSVVSIPAEVKKQALDICFEQGFTTTYMSTVAFEDGMAEGYFNCRGSGGN